MRSPEAEGVTAGAGPSSTHGAKRIAYVVTSPLSAWALLRGQLAHLRERGYEVHLITSPGPQLDAAAEREGVIPHAVPMSREIAPLADLGSLLRLLAVLRSIRPDIMNVGTPKAGLLGGVASALLRVPRRVYVLRGLRLETATGWRRRLLWTTERLACLCAQRVVCVSPSLRDSAIALGLVGPRKAVVLGGGSSNGVDTARFAPSPALLERARVLRSDLAIREGAPVIGFVGRFTRDKGIAELAEAFARLRRRFPEARLLLLGDYEEGDPVPEAARAVLDRDPNVVRPGFVSDPAPYYHLCDVLALPTYREGFPNAALEAAATGKPIVATDATGARDAVVHGETGLVVPVRDADALAEALEQLLASPERARAMGGAARARAVREFAPEVIWSGLADLYEGRGAPQQRSRGEAYAGKRWFDLLVSVPVLVALSPLLLLVAVLVRWKLGAPVLFRQVRPGVDGRPFELWKFRTMTDARDEEGELLPDAERLTAFGRLLRSTSLDELPTLVNVIRGDMSLVGPRPLLMEYLPRYSPEQARRNDVRPGVTGWAQVNGRNDVPWSRKLAMDTWYVDHAGFLLDLRILAMTVGKVLAREGISREGEVTTRPFTGAEADGD